MILHMRRHKYISVLWLVFQTYVYKCLCVFYVFIKGSFIVAFKEQKTLTFKYSWNYRACEGSTGSDQWWEVSVHDDQPQRIIGPATPLLWVRSQLLNRDQTLGVRESDGWVCSFSELFALDICFYQQCESCSPRGFSEIRDTLVLNDTAESSAPDLIWLPVTVGHLVSLVPTGIFYASEPVKKNNKIKDVVKN